MQPLRKKAVVSFTGGKDCCLSLFRALQEDKFDVVALATFQSSNLLSYMNYTHPLKLIEKQAEALNLPLEVFHFSEPHFDGYRNSILALKEKYGAEILITGDILEVTEGYMDKVAEGTGVSLWKPLMGIDRDALLNELFSNNFKVIFSCVSCTSAGEQDSEKLVGRTLSPEIFDTVVRRNVNHIDLGGEFGEFHTMVLDAPMFCKSINIQGAPVRTEEYNLISYEVHDILLMGK
ncbi:adenine nucleotide alpha hydrolases-like protein [Basidiobolus meristosporus CBS 931.73]|uniref:Diphthine--ammonia ligase n=1 Tax=Basidiobolus meristosporus CBS 931.73 TaxID=1314790 RepID=A0A1Y1XAT6_9FUNG|nr:adenine nucleotide alpha hydrolases-like protein [Basidiobolus meristosporus CBS 931.73]|eukprot:ORX82850.1 adenine nucleotide alpha hydrolases-like protein [Basidiobolus meristosporus CBS 931.73]